MPHVVDADALAVRAPKYMCTYGEVWDGTWRGSPVHVFQQVVYRDTCAGLAYRFEHVQRLAASASPYVQRPLAIQWSQHECTVVLEPTDSSLRGDMKKRHPRGMPRRDVMRLGAEVAHALEAVHSVSGALHLNINPDTVRLSNSRARLGGFCVCRPRGSTYMSTASDIFSLGRVLEFALAGTDDGESGALESLLRAMTAVAPGERPTLATVRAQLPTID
jgi:serine/threonine protein kinase